MAGVKSIVTVNTREYDFALNHMKRSHTRIQRASASYIRRLTHYTQKFMKFYTIPRTRRATGKINKNVRSQVTHGFFGSTGLIWVHRNRDTQHVWATEKGISRNYTIRATGRYMKFPVSSWRRAPGEVISKHSKSGMFYFKTVKRGQYKGKYFRDRTYNKLVSYYGKTKWQLYKRLTQAL